MIGFIDLYKTGISAKLRGINHKNCLIIDIKNKYIIRFEPKKTDMIGLSKFRFPINENIIKQQLNKLFDRNSNIRNVDDYTYLEIRGNQSNISMDKDSVYCTIYSLYAALLFIKNYEIFKTKFNELVSIYQSNNTDDFMTMPKTKKHSSISRSKSRNRSRSKSLPRSISTKKKSKKKTRHSI